MSGKVEERKYDVVVVGGGAAGVSAAIAAAKNGSKTILIEAGSYVGGEAISGLPILGSHNARGERILGGVGKSLLDASKKMGGFVEEAFEWRLMYGTCVDPVMLKLAVVKSLSQHGVTVLLYSFVDEVIVRDNRVTGVVIVNKKGRSIISGDMFVDCTGDGDLAVSGGASYEKGGPNKTFQPVSLVFWMSHVDYRGYLEFVRDNPEEFVLAESPVIKVSKAQCAQEIYNSGHPFSMLNGKGKILSAAAEAGEMFPTWSIFTWPTSPNRGEIGFNTTRVADIDATDPDVLSTTLVTLSEQIEIAQGFLKKRVPGFKHAQLAGIASRIGIRETRRIIGEYALSDDDVLEGRKSDLGVAKGAHHVDIHGSGTAQERKPVKDGMSYDIPYGCLVPKDLDNVYVSGRCISATRAAHGSARVIGQCMATGEAAATAAALCVKSGFRNTREVNIKELRETLRKQGAIIDGTL